LIWVRGVGSMTSNFIDLNSAMKFDSLWTDRLVLRPFRLDDAEGLAKRRSELAVARFQYWTMPFPMERAEEMAQNLAAMDGPANDDWWMAIIADPETDEVFGDLAIHMTQEMRSVEVGYTLASKHWGNGYATEALEAMLGWLWTDPRLTRASAMLHPDNIASAMVLERTGFVFEGHTRLSYWVENENSDDWIYGQTRQERLALDARSTRAPSMVELFEIDHSNMRDVLALRTHKTQERFVAPMPISFSNALFPDIDNGAPLVPWLRSVRADGELVGFVMMSELTEVHSEPFLWRLLIDRLHQRRGIGRLVLDALVAEWRDRGAVSMLVSWGQGRGSPGPFYLSYGFVPTGEVEHDEIVARLDLDRF